MGGVEQRKRFERFPAAWVLAHRALKAPEASLAHSA